MGTFFSAALRLGIIAIALLALAAVSACSSESTDDERVQVVTTLPLFADMIENVGGDRVEVTALLPRGADPHTWEPAPKDARKVEEADIFFVNGLDLEPQAVGLIFSLGEGVPLIELASELFVQGTAESGPEHSEGDPHVWMNPANALSYASTIRDELATIDPGGKEAYSVNFEKYAAEMEMADEYLQTAAESVPAERRKLITTHDAFGYLADHIRFEITAFVAAGPGQDASPDDVRSIVEAVEEQGVPAVFTEPQISGESETLEQVARDTGAMICTLYSDSLDDEVSTYIEMMQFNADEIARCLGGADGG